MGGSFDPLLYIEKQGEKPLGSRFHGRERENF